MQQTTGRPQERQASDASLGRQPVSVSAADSGSSSPVANGAVDPNAEMVVLFSRFFDEVNRRLGALERQSSHTVRQDQVTSGQDESSKRLREQLIRNPRIRTSLPGAGPGHSAASGGSIYQPLDTFYNVDDPRADLLRTPAPVHAPPHVDGRKTMSPDRSSLNSPHRFAMLAEEPSNDDERKKGADDGTAQQQIQYEVRRQAQDEERLRKQARAPCTFSGNASDEIPEVRDWVATMDAYLSLMMGAQRDGAFALDYVSTRLVGPALDWMRARRLALEERRQDPTLGDVARAPPTWGELKVCLVEEFESKAFRELKRLELKALRLGSSEHPTVPLFTAAFDKLARFLFPVGTVIEGTIGDSLIADEYDELIRKSDVGMWKDIVRGGRPRSLAHWKESVANAWCTKEILAAQDAASSSKSQGKGSWRGRGGKWNRGNEQRAAVNEVSTPGADGDSEAAGKDEAQPGASVEAQQLQVKNKKKPANESQRMLTEEQHAQVMREGRCFQCYQKGHRIGDSACKEKGKPRRKPTVQELKD